MIQSGYNRPHRRRLFLRFLVATLLVIGLLMILADRQQKTLLESGRLTSDDMSARIMGVMAAPLRTVEAGYSNIEARRLALRENKDLHKEVARLRKIENRMVVMQTRLRRFEDMLGVENTAESTKPNILARAVSEREGPFVHSALLNVGRNKGVVPGYAVLSEDGLYGHIVRVGRNSSRVLLLNDLNSRISVMSHRSLARALMVGQNKTHPVLQFIAKDADWAVGDKVVSSGDGGVLPRGLLVGRTVKGDDGRLHVELFVDRTPVDWVWIVPFTPINPPEAEADLQPDTAHVFKTRDQSNTRGGEAKDGRGSTGKSVENPLKPDVKKPDQP